MNLKIPPPVIFLTALTLTELFPRLILPLPKELALVFFSFGAVIALLALYAFHQAHTTINPHHPERTSVLVTTGIYRLSRNPMYLALVCWLIAFGLFRQQGWGIILSVGVIYYLTQFQIKPEEIILEQKFGQAFWLYKQKTRRWI